MYSFWGFRTPKKSIDRGIEHQFTNRVKSLLGPVLHFPYLIRLGLRNSCEMLHHTILVAERIKKSYLITIVFEILTSGYLRTIVKYVP